MCVCVCVRACVCEEERDGEGGGGEVARICMHITFLKEGLQPGIYIR